MPRFQFYLDGNGSMSSDDQEEISHRYGDTTVFEDSFISRDRLDMKPVFQEFNSLKSNTDTYEIHRQKFLKLLGQHKMVWHQTNDTIDMGVDVSRIYGRNKSEYLAFMRIMPKGFRGERTIPANKEMVFHLLIGKVVFTYRKKPRPMTRGQFINLLPKSTYSIRSTTPEQPTYLVFRIIDRLPAKELPAPSSSNALQLYQPGPSRR